MSLAGAFDRPLLRRYPDARRSPLPLFEPMMLPYLAILFGSPIAGVVGAYNALALRRFGLALLCIGAGAAGWLAFALIIVRVDDAHGNIAVALIVGRIVHFVIGVFLFLLQRPYIRGHAFLRGKLLPAVGTYVTAFVIALLMQGHLWLLLMGVPPGR